MFGRARSTAVSRADSTRTPATVAATMNAATTITTLDKRASRRLLAARFGNLVDVIVSCRLLLEHIERRVLGKRIPTVVFDGGMHNSLQDRDILFGLLVGNTMVPDNTLAKHDLISGGADQVTSESTWMVIAAVSVGT